MRGKALAFCRFMICDIFQLNATYSVASLLKMKFSMCKKGWGNRYEGINRDRSIDAFTVISLSASRVIKRGGNR